MTKALSNKIYIKPLYLENALAITLSDSITATIPRIIDIRDIMTEFKTYISALGTYEIGPLIMKTEIVKGANRQSCFITTYIQQLDAYVSRVEAPYKMLELISNENCLFSNFTGQKNDLLARFSNMQSFAKDKGLTLANEIYMRFIFQDCDEDNISADIFIPVK